MGLTVRDGSGNPPRGPGRGTLPEVQNGLGDPPGSSGLVGVPSRRSGTGLKVLWKVRNGSVGPFGG